MIPKTAAWTLTMAAALAVSLAAQPMTLWMSPENVERLSPEAQEHFDQAVETLHSNPRVSLSELAQAAELAPDVIRLQLMTADFAMGMWVQTSSPESNAHFATALDVCERLVDNPETDPRLIQRLRNRVLLFGGPASDSAGPAAADENSRRISEILERIDERQAQDTAREEEITETETAEEVEE